jgi:hypothetical protein
MRKITIATILALCLTLAATVSIAAQVSSIPLTASHQLTVKKTSTGQKPAVSLASSCLVGESITKHGGTAITSAASVSCSPALAYGTIDISANHCFLVLGACLWYDNTIDMAYCTIGASHPSCSGSAILSSGRWDIIAYADVITSGGDELSGGTGVTVNY